MGIPGRGTLLGAERQSGISRQKDGGGGTWPVLGGAADHMQLFARHLAGFEVWPVA